MPQSPFSLERTRQETGYVIIDEPFWKTVERLQREDQNHSETEEQAHVIRHTGCAILDSGASTGVTCIPAADELQRQRLNAQEPGQPTVSPSDRRFRFDDGNSGAASKIDFNLLAKETHPAHQYTGFNSRFFATKLLFL